MKDYEQMYYDLLYDYNKLKKDYENIKIELEVQKIPKNIEIKSLILKELKRYKKKEDKK